MTVGELFADSGVAVLVMFGLGALSAVAVRLVRG